MSKGTLVLCSTSIGNDKDLTVHVIEALENGTIFVAEDTRTFKNLCRVNGINLEGKKIYSFHDQSKESDLQNIIKLLQSGEEVFYFSEAGSPVISDPGFPLVKAANDLGISVITRPGASSVIAALELSGLPSIPFSFHGFLPREKAKIEKVIEKISMLGGTHVFFESPRRVGKLLSYLEEHLGNDNFPDNICLVREITKVNQQVLTLNKNNFKEKKSDLVELGEFVIILHYAAKKSILDSIGEAKFLSNELVGEGLNKKKLSKLLALFTGKTSKSIYQSL